MFWASMLTGGAKGAVKGALGLSTSKGGRKGGRRRKSKRRLSRAQMNELMEIKQTLGKTAAANALHRYL